MNGKVHVWRLSIHAIPEQEEEVLEKEKVMLRLARIRLTVELADGYDKDRLPHRSQYRNYAQSPL